VAHDAPERRTTLQGRKRKVIPLSAVLPAFLAGLLAQPAMPPPPDQGFLLRSLEHEGRSLPYVVYVPREWTPERSWPAILFLHGMGECGDDGLKPMHGALAAAIVDAAADWPFVVVMPQKPSPLQEWEQHEAAVLALLDLECRRWNVDPDRVHLTGLSQGGHGAWVLGARHASRWASVVPICGYPAAPATGWEAFDVARAWPEEATAAAATRLAGALRGVPVRVFHGDADPVLPVALSRACDAALRAAGGKVELTVWRGMEHNVWDRAYRETGLAAWMLARRRGAGR
jgi:predicted peptidase